MNQKEYDYKEDDYYVSQLQYAMKYISTPEFAKKCEKMEQERKKNTWIAIVPDDGMKDMFWDRPNRQWTYQPSNWYIKQWLAKARGEKMIKFLKEDLGSLGKVFIDINPNDINKIEACGENKSIIYSKSGEKEIILESAEKIQKKIGDAK